VPRRAERRTASKRKGGGGKVYELAARTGRAIKVRNDPSSGVEERNRQTKDEKMGEEEEMDFMGRP